MENVKEILDSYRAAVKYTRSCFRELNEARLAGVRSPSFNGFSRSPGIGSSSVELQVEKIEMLERKAAKAREKALDLADQIFDMIDTLEDYTEKSVIRLRYLAGYSWPKVANVLQYSDKNVRRINRNAIKKLNAGRDGWKQN